jgi:hypothetical protein
MFKVGDIVKWYYVVLMISEIGSRSGRDSCKLRGKFGLEIVAYFSEIEPAGHKEKLWFSGNEAKK